MVKVKIWVYIAAILLTLVMPVYAISDGPVYVPSNVEISQPQIRQVATQATIFFGEDTGLGESTRLASFPNAAAAQAAFLANLANAGVENFEGFADGTAAPLAVNFGAAGTATLQGNGNIAEVITGTNGFGRYPISGTKYWESTDVFYIDFAQPQVAFGFYGIDVGDFNGQLTITYADGSSQTKVVPHTVGSPGGTVIYFGFIDTNNPFTSITFGNTAPGVDYFGFDDFTIGTREQVISKPVPAFTSVGIVILAGMLGVIAFVAIRRRL